MRQLSSWVPWVATLAVAAVIIVIAAKVEGLKIQAGEHELEVQQDGVPGRATVYPEHVSAPPTIVTLPKTKEFTGLEKLPLKYELWRSTALQSGPGPEYIKVRDLFEGEEVWVLGPSITVQDQEWRRVQTDEGQVGWCMTDKLMPISSGE